VLGFDGYLIFSGRASDAEPLMSRDASGNAA